MVLKDTFVADTEIKLRLIVRVPTPAELGVRRLNNATYRGPEDTWKLVPCTLQLIVDAQTASGLVNIVLADIAQPCANNLLSWEMKKALEDLIDAWVMQFIDQTILPKTFIAEPITPVAAAADAGTDKIAALDEDAPF